MPWEAQMPSCWWECWDAPVVASPLGISWLISPFFIIQNLQMAITWDTSPRDMSVKTSVKVATGTTRPLGVGAWWKKHCFSRVICDGPPEVRLMRFRMFRELKLMVLGLFSGLRALGRDPGGWVGHPFGRTPLGMTCLRFFWTIRTLEPEAGEELIEKCTNKNTVVMTLARSAWAIVLLMFTIYTFGVLMRCLDMKRLVSGWWTELRSSQFGQQWTSTKPGKHGILWVVRLMLSLLSWTSSERGSEATEQDPTQSNGLKSLKLKISSEHIAPHRIFIEPWAW